MSIKKQFIKRNRFAVTFSVEAKDAIKLRLLVILTIGTQRKDFK
jgi:hypothetical protein